MATSRWVTDFSICESCCWGFWPGQRTAMRGRGGRRAAGPEGQRAVSARSAGDTERLTFLGARREEPWEERIEEDESSAMGGERSRRRCEEVMGRAEGVAAWRRLLLSPAAGGGGAVSRGAMFDVRRTDCWPRCCGGQSVAAPSQAGLDARRALDMQCVCVCVCVRCTCILDTQAGRAAACSGVPCGGSQHDRPLLGRL